MNAIEVSPGLSNDAHAKQQMREAYDLRVAADHVGATAGGGDCDRDRDGQQLTQLINQYSEQHGTRFVIDPRVQANVNTAGIDHASLDAAALVGILKVYGFTALSDGDIVYVVPQVVADREPNKYGTEWRG